MIFDSKLSFEKQITNVVQSCIYHLRSISKIRSFLSQPDLEKVIHACTSSRLHYCNALYSGLSKKAISGLQLVQKASARLLTNTRRQEHISPVLAFLHWLQISFRIDFNILLINFKALHGSAPSYIADMPLPYEPGCSLRSSGRALLVVPESLLRAKGGWASQGPSALELPAWQSETCRISNILPSYALHFIYLQPVK